MGPFLRLGSHEPQGALNFDTALAILPQKLDLWTRGFKSVTIEFNCYLGVL